MASNIECPRCGVISSDFVIGVCRTCYMRDYHQRHFVSSATVTHDIYGRRLCIECREPGTYARGLCAKCYKREHQHRHRMLLHLWKLWRLVSVITKRRSLLLTVLPTAARHAAQSAKECP
jgi:hypothetical protein